MSSIRDCMAGDAIVAKACPKGLSVRRCSSDGPLMNNGVNKP